MEQVFFGGYYGNLHTTLPLFNVVEGSELWRTPDFYVRQLVSTDGVIKQLRVRLDGAPGAGKKYTFVLILNGNPTALTFDIENLETVGGDMVNEVVVTGADYVCIRCTPTGTPTARHATWTSVFEGDNPKESLILGNTYENMNKLVIEYSQVMTASSNFTATENDFRQVCPTDGTIKNFYVQLNIDPGTPPDAYRFTLRKGPPAGPQVSQTLTVTITANAITGSDLVNSFAVAAGDILTMMIEPLNTPLVTPRPFWGLTFVADIDGESIVLGGSYQGLDRWNTKYNILTGRNSLGWAVENQRYQLGQVCTLKKLYMLLSAAPGAGKHWDFNLRFNGAASNVVTTISDAATTGNSGALEDDVALDEYVDLEADPDTIPDAADAYWGFVCYIAAGWTGKISGVVDPDEIAGVSKVNIAEVKGVA